MCQILGRPGPFCPHLFMGGPTPILEQLKRLTLKRVKIETIGETTFTLAAFPACSRVSMNPANLNLLKRLWIIQMVWQLFSINSM